MTYCLDLKRVSIEDYKEILKKQNLLPGRRILLEEIDSKFQAIADSGIKNLYELRSAISNPNKLKVYSVKSTISEEYLTILRRELGSFEQKPVKISDFPGILSDHVARLADIGIKTSKDLYELYYSGEKKEAVVLKTGIPADAVDELMCLCNLVRINGAGAVAARIFYEAGYKNLSDIADADAEEMLNSVIEVNSKKQYTKVKLGKKDMQFCIDYVVIMLKISEEK